jgi:hypothetical protein
VSTVLWGHPRATSPLSGLSRLILSGRVRLRRWSLDDRLAGGEDAAASAELALRAEQLVSPKVRLELADELCRTVRAAEQPPRPLSAALPLQREPILCARERMLELADDLAFGPEVNPWGVALVERLLRDGGSPLYGPPVHDTVDTAVRRARAALLLA